MRNSKNQITLDRLNKLGGKCDDAILKKDEKQIEECIKECKEFLKENDANEGVAKYLNYWIGNLFSRKSYINSESVYSWKSNQFPTNLVECLNHHRKSLTIPAKTSIDDEVRTNVANELKRFDRVVEAFDFWNCDFSLKGDTPFISSYHKGLTLFRLARYINDPGHAERYIFEAYKTFKKLRSQMSNCTHGELIDQVKSDQIIKNLIKYGDKTFKKKKSLKELADKRNCSGKELKYRDWCLKNKLFLNHLNDLTTSTVANQDILQFPNHTTPIMLVPYFAASFSAIKREYCFARFMAFEAIHEIHPSYENKGLYLIDTLDWVRYEGYIEKLKASFRLAFSTLDSLANLMYRYFCGKSSEENIYFSGTFIRKNIGSFDNQFVSSLYWLACDLTDNDKGNLSQNWRAPNPDGKVIRQVRNALEHGWLRISDQMDIQRNHNDFADFVITSEEFKSITLQTFKLVRSAILYFVLAVKLNEDELAASDKKTAATQPFIWQDDLSFKAL